MKRSILVIAVLISGLILTSQIVTSCGNKSEQSTEEDHTHGGDSTSHDAMKGDSTALAYACPMHPDVIGKDGDTCPKCNMKLEQVKEADSANHEH